MGDERGRKRRDRTRERFWREVVRRQKRSGLSISAFCQQDELAESAFYFWRRELLRREAESSGPVGPARHDSAASATNPSRRRSSSLVPPPRRMERSRRPRFARLCVTPSELPSRSAAIEIVLPSGVQLRVFPGASRQALVDALLAVEQRPC
jgi:transposase-like protein